MSELKWVCVCIMERGMGTSLSLLLNDQEFMQSVEWDKGSWAVLTQIR